MPQPGSQHPYEDDVLTLLAEAHHHFERSFDREDMTQEQMLSVQRSIAASLLALAKVEAGKIVGVIKDEG